MSNEAQRGLAAIRGLFAKAANMGGTDNDDELEAALEEDFEDLDQATAAADAEGATPPAEADDDEYDEEEEGEAPPPDEEDMSMVGKAANPSEEHDDDGEQDVDAGPILQDIAKAWRGMRQELHAIRQQNALLAKGLMGLVDEQETVAKSVGDVRREVDESARLPKSGRGKPAKRHPQRGEQLDKDAIVAKAVQDTQHFSSRDVAKLDSMLGRGDLASVQREFEPAQIHALGLTVKN